MEAPSNVTERTHSRIIRSNSTGISTLQVFSIPFCTPLITTNAVKRTNNAKSAIGSHVLVVKSLKIFEMASADCPSNLPAPARTI